MFKIFNKNAPAPKKHCLLCCQITTNKHICSICQKSLPWVTSSCRQCGVQVNNSQVICGKCITHPKPWQQIIAPFHYTTPVNEWLTGIKFHQDLTSLTFLHETLKKAVDKHYSNKQKPSLIVPTPISKRRFIQRGYNQAYLLAKAFKKTHDIIPCHQCQRIKHTRPQSALPVKERKTNTRNAFKINAQLPKHVAILDDIFTTGSTVKNLAYALRKQGVEEIDIWVIALS